MSSTRKGSGSSVSGSRKRRSLTPTERVCEGLVRKWLARSFTGCRFAQSLASSNQMWFSAFDQVTQPDVIDAVFDAAASEHLPAIVVLPTIRSEEQLLDQLRILATGERWKTSRETLKLLRTEDLLVGVQWTTSEGLTSMPMGFAPFPTMPVTRRAPYVCLATWPGGHENPLPHRRKPNPRSVDFLDSALADSLTKKEYDALWNASVARTGEMLTETGDDPRFYRSVAYRLSPTAALSALAPPARP